MTPVMKALIVANIAVYILGNLLLYSIAIDGMPGQVFLMKYFALQPVGGLVAYGGVEFNFYPWQLITYQFMHGGFMHLFFNMFGIWMFSSELEQSWGSVKFLTYYLLAGVGAGVLHMFMSMSMGSIAPTIGASGSLYGIIIGFAMLNPDRKIMMFPIFIPIPARIFGIGMMVLSLLMGFSNSGNIAHFAHLGGALTGLLLVKFGEKLSIFNLARKYFNFGLPSNEYLGNNNGSIWGNNFGQSQNKFDNERGYSQYSSRSSYTTNSSFQQEVKTDSKPKQFNLNDLNLGGAKVTQATIDAILDKISKTGYHSLTEQEKYILTEISKRL